MLLFHRIRDLISERKTSTRGRKFLSMEEQIDGWDRANQKMAWGIKDVERNYPLFGIPTLRMGA